MKIINRRAFIGTMGVAGASLLAGCAPEAKSADLAATGEGVTEGAEAAAAWAPVEANPEIFPMIAEPAPAVLTDEQVQQFLANPAQVTEDWVYADGTTIAPAFQMARNAINRNGIGVGSMVNRDHHLDLWPYLFSEEEALLYSQMPNYVEFTIAELAEKTGRSKDECRTLCDQIADRGLLRRVHENGEALYATLSSEYGYYEAYVQHFNKEYLMLKGLNQSADIAPTFVDSGSTMYRSYPVDLDVCIDGAYTQWDDWRDIFKRHDRFAVSPCMCRCNQMILGGMAETVPEIMEKGLTLDDHPTETCIVTGKQAEWLIDIEAAREITADEAVAIVENAIEKGMIIESVYTKAAENVCCCHADCCLNVGAIRTLNGGPDLKNYSDFDLMHKKDDCIKCGMCEKQCPMFSITMGDEGYPVVDGACVRCGQCATVCPQGARGLKLKDEADLPEIPETLLDDYKRKAEVRASKGYLFDITSQAEMEATVEQMFEQAPALAQIEELLVGGAA